MMIREMWFVKMRLRMSLPGTQTDPFKTFNLLLLVCHAPIHTKSAKSCTLYYVPRPLLLVARTSDPVGWFAVPECWMLASDFLGCVCQASTSTSRRCLNKWGDLGFYRLSHCFFLFVMFLLLFLIFWGDVKGKSTPLSLWRRVQLP